MEDLSGDLDLSRERYWIEDFVELNSDLYFEYLVRLYFEIARFLDFVHL